MGNTCEYPIRKLSGKEIPEALSLAWKVFCEYESPVYSDEGTEEFRKSLHSEEYLSGISYYGAFDCEKLIGEIGIRTAERHICFFFVDSGYQRRGIGRGLFRYLLKDFPEGVITLNSAPYGLPFYKAIGFVPAEEEKTVNGIRFTPMRYVSLASERRSRLINDDYVGYSEHLRHACRGILVRDGRILLSYESRNNRYMIPGGGAENGETFFECCERELREETGIAVKAVRNFLEIEELFDRWQHINHYFVCEYVGDTGVQHLTESEERAGYVPVWMPFPEALRLFGDYERYHTSYLPDYGLYRREYTALKAYTELREDK